MRRLLRSCRALPSITNPANRGSPFGFSTCGEELERIARDPIAWSPTDEDVRRCLTRVFPFALYYTIEPEFILILAIAHLAREPGYWASRR